jgi:hypothetical protein
MMCRLMLLLHPACRAVASPADISMDISRLQQDLGLAMTPFRKALQAIFAK